MDKETKEVFNYFEAKMFNQECQLRALELVTMAALPLSPQGKEKFLDEVDRLYIKNIKEEIEKQKNLKPEVSRFLKEFLKANSASG